tara:strand:- start:617 stop:1093 length:477 start_codon:yes stop_codon:yes gene_type:complete
VITLTIVSIIVLALTATASAGRSPAEKVARTVTKVWSCQDAIGVPRTKTGNIWAKHSPGYRRYQLRVWKARLEQCRQWNYKAWLPAHWQRVAQCETQTNWRHSNSSYQGAFGFAISSWDAFKLAGYPNEAWQATPWQQYQVALQIYNRFGMSGWGCKG